MSARLRIRKHWIAVVTIMAFTAMIVAAVWLPALPHNAPSVLVSVDNTLWNRLGFNRLTHVRALRVAGLRPVMVDFTVSQEPTMLAADLLAGMDALVIGGGGDVDTLLYKEADFSPLAVNTIRDQFELALLTEAERLGLPILGICRGAQLVNVYRGGTLGDFRADAKRYQRHHRILGGHAVNLAADSKLAAIYGDTRLDNVVTFHGQHVDLPGRDVRVVAYSQDGTPEAIEVKTTSDFGMLGVQWHAEALPWDTDQQKLFDALFVAASGYRANTNKKK